MAKTVSLDKTEAGVLFNLGLPVEKRVTHVGKRGTQYFGNRADVLAVYASDDCSRHLQRARAERTYRRIPKGVSHA